jgi:enediyne biosynthesis thioesterase
MSKPSFDVPHVVTFEETNLLGNVYYTNYFAWQGRCRELFLRKHASAILDEIESGQLRLVTAHASCDFFDEYRAFDDVLIRMRLDRFIPYGVSLGFEYCGSGAHEVLARGRQDLKFLRPGERGWDLAEVPPLLMKELQRYE